jgi:heme A synthase
VKQTYRVVAGLIALGVVVQAGAIAFGWFDALNKIDNGLVVDKNYQGNAGHAIHSINGQIVIPLLGLILLVVSFFAAKEIPGARKWAGIVFGVIVLQVALAFVAFAAPIVGALHGVNALVLLGTAVRTSMLAREAGTPGRSAGRHEGSVPKQGTGPTISTETSRPA